MMKLSDGDDQKNWIPNEWRSVRNNWKK